jgi:hypothetical protein
VPSRKNFPIHDQHGANRYSSLAQPLLSFINCRLQKYVALWTHGASKKNRNTGTQNVSPTPKEKPVSAIGYEFQLYEQLSPNVSKLKQKNTAQLTEKSLIFNHVDGRLWALSLIAFFCFNSELILMTRIAILAFL